MKCAIVYLAQNSPRDPQYGRDSRSLLEKSLALLFENYNNEFRHDVIIFHEGDFKERDQVELTAKWEQIKFHKIKFELPPFLRAADIPEVWGDNHDVVGFQIGYRHMIRFYAVMIFDILSDLGYEWFLRMDDDSFIHSRIEYDLFDFMERGGFEYGYRVDFREDKAGALGFSEAVLGYLAAETQIVPTFMGEHLVVASTATHAKNFIKAKLMRFGSRKQYRLRSTIEHDLRCYYNNFFITQVAFWKRPDVQKFIHHFDRIGGWYRYRWGDAIFQSAAVQIFLPKRKVYKFTDWTYEHATIYKEKLLWGGIFQGGRDPDETTVARFKERYGVTNCLLTRQRDRPIKGVYS